MEFEGKIIEILDTKTGTNAQTGAEWKKISYVAQTEEKSPQTIVIDVWDGRDGRIDRLNTPYTDLFYYHLVSKSVIDLAIKKALQNKKKFNETAFFNE